MSKIIRSHVCGVTCFHGGVNCNGYCLDQRIPSPKTYELDTFDFGEALKLLKAGKLVARENWNGKGMFLLLVPGSTFKVSRAPLLGIFPEGTEINYLSHIDMRTATGEIVPWLASQTDALCEDWVEVTT